jgi:hypothetical protein
LMSSFSSSCDNLTLMMTFLSRAIGSSGTIFVYSWSMRSVLPFGMYRGS